MSGLGYPIPKWISNVKSARRRRKWKFYWNNPWRVPTSPARAAIYKYRLRKHGRYSTNFTISEWKSKSDGCGCSSTASPHPHATQKLAFKVERVRHRLGDIPIRNASVYRNPCHEGCIGGAWGYHPKGQAIDPVKPSGMSVSRWNDAWYAEFGGGGIGIDGGSGAIRHADTRTYRSRWYY